MNFQNLLAAIADYDNGLKQIQNANLRAFLYKRKWYPLRAVVNRAEELSTGHYQDLTVEKCLTGLAYIFPYYVRIEDIPFNNGQPVPITDAEALQEIQLVNKVLASFF